MAADHGRDRDRGGLNGSIHGSEALCGLTPLQVTGPGALRSKGRREADRDKRFSTDFDTIIFTNSEREDLTLTLKLNLTLIGEGLTLTLTLTLIVSCS